MTRPIAVLVLAIAGLGWLAATSCTVNRRSDDYACSNNGDCQGGRTCEAGYCVAGGGSNKGNDCPSPCTSCDLDAMTCAVECSASSGCGSFQCPPGFDCTIQCNDPNACDDIDCSAGKSCRVSCAGQVACRTVRCGTKPCEIDCMGTAACAAIQCDDSCRCDVRCNSLGACPITLCPSADGMQCRENGSPTAPCDSTNGAACDTCL